MIRWTPANCAKLERLYGEGKSDIQISEVFGTINRYAIGKQRSKLGLVPFKKLKHTRAAKTTPPPINKAFSVLYYLKEGQNHFVYVDDISPNSANELAKQILLKQGVKEVLTLRPSSKLIMQGITEVKL